MAESQNPLYFFDGDADGACSFLMLYRLTKEGHGVFVGRGIDVERLFKQRIATYQPDRIFVLDLYSISQELIDQVSQPIALLDHHEPIKRTGLYYVNPRIWEDADNRPTSYWVYQMVQQDLWLATIGTVADWHLPEFLPAFADAHPLILPKLPKTIGEALYKTPLGKLIRIISFSLKGTARDALKYVKILSRIQTPEEILFQESAAGRYIYRKYEKVKAEYDRIKKSFKPGRGDLKVFVYDDYSYSLSSDFSNEMSIKYPGKAILVARKNTDSYACSLRGEHFDIAATLKKALAGIQGFGGGHRHACGCSVASEDFERFVENLKRELIKE